MRIGTDSADPTPLIVTLGTALDSIEEYAECYGTGKRWPRLRYGDRATIPAIKRRLIFERDGQSCWNCTRHLLYREAQIDHIMPWSAWGSDCSCNLRILCEPCNTFRSNFRTGLDTGPRLHVALGCTACEPSSPVADDMLIAYCGRCGNIAPTCPELAL
jgi:hypothetical protein